MEQIKAFGAALAACDAKTVVGEMEAAGQAVITVDGTPTEISSELVDVTISAKEGFVVSMENNVFTILDTAITQELKEEGLAREFISKIQQMRKGYDFDMMDQIRIYYTADAEAEKALMNHKAYIMEETLAVSMEPGGDGLEEYKLNGHDTGIQVEKV